MWTGWMNRALIALRIDITLDSQSANERQEGQRQHSMNHRLPVN